MGPRKIRVHIIKATAIIPHDTPAAEPHAEYAIRGADASFATGSPGLRACATLIMFSLALALLLALPASASNKPTSPPLPPSKPSKHERCPVCGMFVYKYPGWLAAVSHANAEVVYFDGAKDMFRYLLDPHGNAGIKDLSAVTATWVTEYYDLSMIDAHKAFYVMGSKVYGPMGHELIPFATRAEAEEFMRDHKGRRILRFAEITPAILKGLK